MDPESKTYEEHAKKATRKLFWLLIGLLIAVTLLSTVFLWVSCRYNQTDAALILLNDDAFTVKDGFLFPADESPDYVASYDLNTGDLQVYPVTSLDLSPYGFQDEYLHFRYLPATAEEGEKGRIVPADSNGLPLSRANTENGFVYSAEGGKKFWINTAAGTAAPLFEGALAEGIDPYAVSVSAFSHNTRFALGLDANVLTVYTRKNTTDFVLEDVKTVDFSEKGTLLSADFLSESYIRAECLKDGVLSYYICNPETGALRTCSADEATIRTPEARVASPYGQLYLPLAAEEKEDKDPYLFRYGDTALGTVFCHNLPADTAVARLCAVSPHGEYALLEHGTSEDSTTLTFSKVNGKWLFFETSGRQFDLETLSSLANLKEGESISKDEIFFLADNIVLVNIHSQDGARSAIFKICF